MKILTLTAAAVLCLTSASASAATFLFNLTGSYQATFSIDTSRAPDVVDDNRLEYNDISVSLAGGATRNAVVRFFNGMPDVPGGFNIGNDSSDLLVDTTGPDLFTNGTGTPDFIVGRFDLTEVRFDDVVPARYSLDISMVDIGAVPEPATWLMMIMGFGLIGGTLRRRRRVMLAC